MIRMVTTHLFFRPEWVENILGHLSLVVKNPILFHEQARKAAVSAMPKLLLSAKLAIGKGQAQGCNETYIKKLTDYILLALVEASHKISGPLLDEAMSDTLSRGDLEEIKQRVQSLLVQVGKES